MEERMTTEVTFYIWYLDYDDPYKLFFLYC
jgi:hypothetical protein